MIIKKTLLLITAISAIVLTAAVCGGNGGKAKAAGESMVGDTLARSAQDSGADTATTAGTTTDTVATAPLPPTIDTSHFTDKRDGQKYRTVKIGTQVWMAQNLNFKTKNSWCYDDNESNCNVYGRLYDWGAAKSACPSGWHLPSSSEWDSLMATVGGVKKLKKGGDEDYYYHKFAGGKLKSKSGWFNNGNGTDDYGFSALPGGYRSSRADNDFFGDTSRGYFWSSTEYIDEYDDDESGAYYRLIDLYRDDMYEYFSDEGSGFAVRCLQE